MVCEIERAAQVVRFWRTVEMFNAQGVPKPNPRATKDAEEHVLDVAPDELAPWEPGHWVIARPLPPRRTWQFTVYGGLYELSAVRDALVSAFGRDSKYPDSRSDGQAALFAFTLDAEGHLVENSALCQPVPGRSAGWNRRAQAKRTGWTASRTKNASSLWDSTNPQRRRMRNQGSPDRG